MLHRIKLPVYDQILERFLAFQEQVLDFACSGKIVLPLRPQQIQSAFPGDTGIWFCKKLWPVNASGNCPLRDHLETLIHYSNDHPTEGQKIPDAFKHDITFFQHFDDPTFTFEYIQLPDASKKAVKLLMMEWYQVFYDGFPHTSAGKLQKFNRQNFVDVFLQENKSLDVCPACDGKWNRIMKRKTYTDVDHFFPKSQYPFLSTHPLNLVPICKECNHCKGSTDPIDQHQNEPLMHIFLPYKRSALDHIEIQVKRDATGNYEVQLLDTSCLSTGGHSRRLQNLDNLFHLKELWENDYVVQASKVIIYEMADIGAMLGEEKKQQGRVAVIRRLKQVLNAPEKKIGQLQLYLLSRSYAMYALSDNDELAALQSQLEGTMPPFVSTRSSIPRSSHRSGTTRGVEKRHAAKQ